MDTQQHNPSQPMNNNNNYYFYQFVTPMFILRDISYPNQAQAQAQTQTQNEAGNGINTNTNTNSNTNINNNEQQQRQTFIPSSNNDYPGRSRMEYSTTANLNNNNNNHGNANANSNTYTNESRNRGSNNLFFGNLMDILFDNVSPSTPTTTTTNNQQSQPQPQTQQPQSQPQPQVQQPQPQTQQQQQQQQQQNNNNNFNLFIDPISLLFSQIFNLQQQQQQQQSLQGQPPASKIAMESLKIVSPYSKLMKHQTTCSICMDDFCETKEKRLRAMPCGHVYHEECIFEWLRKSNTCANCRYEIETDNAEYNNGVRKRMADRHPVFVEHECALSSQGCCDYEDQNGEEYLFMDHEHDHEKMEKEEKEKEEEEEKHLIKCNCGCTFHDTCLRTALLVRGYNIPETGGNVEFRCPKCNKESEITFASLS